MREKIYKKVTEYLKEAISGGKMKLGDAIYSENQLCGILNVSRTTVRRAIREMVEDNILESRQGTGTFVKGLNPTGTVCLVNHYTRRLRYSSIDSYYTDFIYAAEGEAEKENFRFQIFSGVVQDENEIRSKMSHLSPDALILDGDYQDHFESIDVFRKYYPNTVVLDGNPEETRLPSVSPDLTPGFVGLLQIIGKSSGKIIFLYSNVPARRRWALHCFRNAVKSSGYDDRVTYLDYAENISEYMLNSINHQYLITETLKNAMSDGKKPSAVFCAGDHCAMCAINALKSSGYMVPGDIAVSGVGGITFSSMTEPPLTTLKILTPQLAEEAVRMLAGQLRGKKTHGTTLLPVQLLRRQSM